MPINRPRLSALSLLTLAAALLTAAACGPTTAPPTPSSATVAPVLAAPTLAAVPPTPAPPPTAAAPSPVAPAAPTSLPTTAPQSSAPTPTAAATATPITTPPPDDWQQEMRAARLYPGQWQTDFSQRSVPYSEIFSGGVPRDGIPPLDNPNFTTVTAADQWLAPQEPVIAFALNGAAKAYPLQILTWHEIVNDTVGGVPIVATFCPLCNSAIVFERTLDGVIYDFGVSGNLRNSDLIMWDRQTESWWQQLTGAAIVGELTGRQLKLLPSSIISWQDFKTAYPDAAILSRDTGHRRDYGQNPYAGYDRADRSPFLFSGDPDDRLLPMERVAALTVGDSAAAFPFSLLETAGVVHYTVGGQDLAVFFQPGARSALDAPSIAESRAVGATGVFLRALNGQTLTFQPNANGFTDTETSSQWNILGQATAGPLAGQKLTTIVHANHFWFAWAAFRPDTEIVRAAP